jgi:hypothetical protein
MRLIPRVLVGSLVVAIASWFAAVSANASTSQVAMFQPGGGLLQQPDATLRELHALGVGVVRVTLPWASIAPDPNSQTRPAGFDATDPAAYPAANWAPFDAVVRAAQADGLRIDFTITGGAPLWADSQPIPPAALSPLYAWLPSPSEYQAFVHAVGLRYDGGYAPPGQSKLPRVSFWAVWNEPNFGKGIAPQATHGSTVLSAAGWYRRLLDAGWNGLQSTGHGRDTILIGTLAARGSRNGPTPGNPDGNPGTFGTTKPLQFIRALYCVDSRSKPLRGSAASAIGCPGGGSAAQFRSSHPGLFSATGFAIHPYPINLPPTRTTSHDPDYVEFSQIPNLESLLDRIQKAYGSRRQYPIYVTEYGYITNPPNRSGHFVSPPTAAKYMNWAEYLSYRNRRIATTMQFLLRDPNPRVGVPEFGGFASGLEFFSGKHKPSYDAYRMPLFLPSTSTRRGRSLEVWGCVRPAPYARQSRHRSQTVKIQFQNRSRGAFKTIKSVRITSRRGYFDVKVTFPGSGSVRLEWSNGQTFHSRIERVRLS